MLSYRKAKLEEELFGVRMLEEDVDAEAKVAGAGGGLYLSLAEREKGKQEREKAILRQAVVKKRGQFNSAFKQHYFVLRNTIYVCASE
jgi:hypothetical protein